MSNHAWHTVTFDPHTVTRGAELVKFSRGNGLDFDHTCAFVGYVLESWRQKGNSGTAETFLAGARKSRFRFMKGKNVEGYRSVGKRMMTYMAGEAG